MAYKDSDKQREADRERQRRYRAERGRQAYPKGVTNARRDKGVTDSGRDKQGVTVAEAIVAENVIPVIPKILKRETLAKITNAEQDSIRATELREFEAIEKACCSEGVIGGDDALPKRCKDITCFEDLPPHVQQTIDIMSDDKTEHKRRTAIAINYQHQFPDRYHSTGVV